MTKKNHTLKTVLLYIVLALIAVIAIFPLFYIVMASFRTNIEIFDYALPFTWKTLIPQEWTFDNYVAIFEEFHFGLAIRNTLIVVAVLVPLSLCISALGGFVFAFFDFKGKNILFALCLISFMVPIDAIVLPLYNLISRLGLVNSYASLILPSAASGLAMFLFTQFFQGNSEEPSGSGAHRRSQLAAGICESRTAPVHSGDDHGRADGICQ